MVIARLETLGIRFPPYGYDTKLSGDRLDLKPKVSRISGNSGSPCIVPLGGVLKLRDAVFYLEKLHIGHT